VNVRELPSVTLTSSQNPSLIGDIVNFTITVSGTRGTATGQVLLLDGGTTIGTASLSNGTTTFSIPGLTAGSHALSATYGGDDNYEARTTETLTQVVNTLGITPGTLPGGTVGVAYSQNLGVFGGSAPYSFTVLAGSLPAGLSLNEASGQLTGTPSSAGTASFTIGVVDSGGRTGSQAYALAVTPAPNIVLTPASWPAAPVGAPYEQSVAASGGTAPYSYTLSAGALPPGLALDTATGAVTGTPTAGGIFNFTISVTDNTGQVGTQAYSLSIAEADIAITPTSLPAATRGFAVSTSFAASGGVAPYSYALAPGSSLPTGVTLSPAGVLGGVPTQTGTFNFTVRATDSATGTGPYVGQQAVTLTVNGAVISLTPANLPDVLEGRPYAQALTASGGVGPYTFAVSGGALPEGVTLSSGGVLSGTPNAAGVFSFDVTATDAFGNSGAATMTLAISARPNPALSADIRGLLSSEDSLSQRFAWTQLGNFHARFDSLRSGGGNGGGIRLSSRIADDAFAYTPQQAQGRQDVFGASFGGPRRFDGQADGMFGGFASDYGWNFAPGEIEGSETSLGLASGGGPIGPREAGSWEFWTGGTIGIGRRDAVDGAARFDFQSEGISAGLDLKLSDRLAVGLGGGFGRERVDIGSDGSTSRAHNGVAAVYGTFTPIENLFVDAVVGGGALSFDLKRYDASASGFAEGTRDGTMRFASLSFGINRKLDRLNWQAFGRIEHLGADLDAYTETGAGIWSLSYLERSLTSTAGALGASASMNGLKIGTALFSPRVRLEWRHEFDEAASQGIRYADWVDSPIYTVTETGLARDQLAIGLGAGLHLDDDWSVAADLSGRFDRDSEAGSMRLEISRRF
jgi:uncharacterized protein YhjY with autotransporter beta-barrel domain